MSAQACYPGGDEMKLFTNRLSGVQTLALAILLMVGLCWKAEAATVTVTGNMPTQNTDNSAIPATGEGSLTNARVEFGSCNGTAFGTKAGEISRPATAPGTAFSYTLNLNPGTSCVRVFVANTYGKESDASNVASRVVDPPTPKPPTLSTVALAGLEIPLDSLDGFKRTVAYTVTSSGPGVLAAFCKIATPAASEPLFTYRGQTYCKPLAKHPRTGAANCAYVKGIGTTAEIAAPCA